MKKFLVLSFLMVLFAGAVSFAQTITTSQGTTNGYNRLGHDLSTYTDSNGDLHSELTIWEDLVTNPLPPGVYITRIAVNMLNDAFEELPWGGTTYDFYNESTAGPVSVCGTITESLYRQTIYSYMIDYSDNTYEWYEIKIQR